MSFFVNTKERTTKEEIMDDFSLAGEVLKRTLKQLALINLWLGGNRLTLKGVKELIKHRPKNQPITIIDLGCGDGNMLRKIANYGRKKKMIFKLIGIDANAFTINCAIEASKYYPEINYLQLDIFSKRFKELKYDIVIATLFFHHFKMKQIVVLLKLLLKQAHYGVVVNDLHRHRVAYYLFKLLTLTIRNNMVKEDGLISILRGFKKKELVDVSKQLKTKSHIRWKWAFRYQWIIRN